MMTNGEGHRVRALYIADYERGGLCPRLTRCAINLANFSDLLLGTWGGEVEPGLIAEAGRSGLRVHRFRFPFYPFQKIAETVRSIREFCDVLNASRINVVHCHCYRHLVLSSLASAFCKQKPSVVFTDHNSTGRQGMRIVSRLSVLAAVRPQVIDLDNYLSRVPFLRGKAAWLPNPVDTSFFRPVERDPEFPGTISLIFPANLSFEKGHSGLLEICHRVRQKGLRFRLVLAGDGPARQSLQDLADRLNLKDVVHFAGHLSRDHLLRELQAADIGVFPSPREMLPYSVLEMLATALPVVAYAAGGIPLIIRHGETGFVAPIGSSQDFEKHLMALMTNPSLARQVGRQAACDAQSRFDIAVVTQQIARLYRHSARVNHA